MNTYQALYYPYIHFKDDHWVKTAALYWDNLGRIVPHEYKTEDSDTVKGLGDFVTTLRPNWVHPEFANSFVEFIQEYGPKLQEKYSISLSEDWAYLEEDQRPPKPGGPSGNNPRFGYIFCEKMSEELRYVMEELNLATTDYRGDHWIGMHPRLAWVYMTSLAEQISAERGLRPLTDQTQDHLALSGFSVERLAHALLGNISLVSSAPTNTEIETTMVSVAFQSVVPKDLANLTVDKILDFREKYPSERASFQNAVSELLNCREWLTNITDPTVLEERLHDEYEKSWNLQLQELRDKLTEVGIDTALSCFNLKGALPGGIAGAAASLAIPLNPIAAGTAGLALAAIPTLRDKRKQAREILADNPMSFLYRMEQDLKPQDLLDRVKQRSLNFALGI